jgi:hypothetical protein
MILANVYILWDRIVGNGNLIVLLTIAIDTITGIHIIMLGYTYISQQYYRVP